MLVPRLFITLRKKSLGTRLMFFIVDELARVVLGVGRGGRGNGVAGDIKFYKIKQ